MDNNITKFSFPDQQKMLAYILNLRLHFEEGSEGLRKEYFNGMELQ